MALPREPLLIPLAGVAAGILAAEYARFDWYELGWAVGGSLVLWLLALIKSKSLSKPTAFLLTVFVGIAASQVHRPAQPPQLDAQDDEVLIIGGCVVDPPTTTEPVARFALEIEPGAAVRVSLTARPGESLPPLSYGTKVEIEAKVRQPRNFQNPGSFDYASYLSRQRIFWTATARGVDKLTVLPGRCGSAWKAIWHNLRRGSLDRVRNLYPSDPYTVAMMSGLLVGDESSIQRTWAEAFRRTGTFHALVISGLHISVIATGMVWLLRICWVPLGVRLVLASSVAWSYAFLAGLQPPVTRAAAGFTLFAVAQFFYRKGRVLNLLAAVALVFLLTDPRQLFEASFQLSFLAVAAIAGLSMPLLDRTATVWKAAVRNLSRTRGEPRLRPSVAALRVELRLLSETLSLCTRLTPGWSTSLVSGFTRCFAWCFESLAVSFAVQIALLLPAIAYFHRVPITSLSANVIAVPALSIAVPFGLTAILTEWRWPAVVAELLLRYARLVIEWHAAIEPDWRTPAVPLWLAIGFVALLAWAIARRSQRALLAMACSAVLILWYPFPAQTAPGKLELTAVDVGQGDALLVVLPDSRTMLIDGGGLPSFDPRVKPRLEIGEDVVSSYLWSRGLKRIDILALTHAHEDHARGLLAILDNFHPRELWTGAQPQTGTWLEIVNKARALGVTIRQKRRGDSSNLGGVIADILAPAPEYQPGRTAKNNDSLVLQLRYGKHRFLLTGDMERQVEADLVRADAVTHADVLKVAHHGSKTSSTAEFLDRARPTFALISTGRYNGYGHPHPDVLDRLAQHGTRVMRTDIDGLVSILSDGKRLELATFASSRQGGGLLAPFSLE